MEKTDGTERLWVYDWMQKMVLVAMCPIDMGIEH